MSDETPPPPADGAPPPPPPPPPPPGDGGGYGPPAPPTPPAYGAPAAGSGGYSATEAVSYGWSKFSKKPADLIVPVLIVAVAVIIVEIVVQVLLRNTLLSTHDCTRSAFGVDYTSQCGPGFFVTILGSGIAAAFVSFLTQMLGAGLIKAGLNVVDGKPVSTAEVFSYATRPNVVVAAALIAVATLVGTILCYIPGLIVGFLTTYTLFFVVDKDMAPMDAIKASVSFTTSHLGETIVFYLLAIVCIIVGAILCGVGLLAAIPVVLVGAAYTFRMLHNEPVTPAA